MFVLLVSCFSTLVFFKSLSLKPIATEYRKLSSFLFQWIQKGRTPNSFLQASINPMQAKKAISLNPNINPNHNPNPKERDQTWEERNFLLELPELALDHVLEKLSAADLCSLAEACSYLRERCTSDHLWEKHLRQKWGVVMSHALFKEWQTHVDCSSHSNVIDNSSKGPFGWLNGVWLSSWFRPQMKDTSESRRTCLPVDSVMALYFSLKSGKFWFPAQVYNRQNGHMGFMLSCYDATLSYDDQSDTFLARYSPNGKRTIEESVQWDRLRVAPIDTPAHTFHVSDCLAELKPGDHVEVQWRKTKEFPYGWWYAIIGHLESCDGNQDYCHCQDSAQILVEFNQYTPGSRWRLTVMDRKEHREEGSEADGYYGGIRKLYKEEEISKWRRFWPDQVYD